MRARALQRGTLVHRLLQSLPDIAPERRREAALKYLARNADGWTEAEREHAGGKVLALIADRALRRYLRPAAAPRSRSSGGWSARAAARRWFPGKSTGWW
jgi:ATP-dependent helicase/nuclease subunit A